MRHCQSHAPLQLSAFRAFSQFARDHYGPLYSPFEAHMFRKSLAPPTGRPAFFSKFIGSWSGGSGWWQRGQRPSWRCTISRVWRRRPSRRSVTRARPPSQSVRRRAWTGCVHGCLSNRERLLSIRPRFESTYSRLDFESSICFRIDIESRAIAIEWMSNRKHIRTIRNRVESSCAPLEIEPVCFRL